MRPAGRLAHAGHSRGVRLVELLEAGIPIRLQDAFEADEMALRMLALAVGRVPVRGAGRAAAGPRPIVPDIGPDPAFPDAALLAALALRRIEHPDRRIVAMQVVGVHDMAFDQSAQRPQRGDGLAAPVDQGRARNVGAVTGEDLALPVQRQMIIELRDQDMGKQVRPGHAAAGRTRRRGRLHDRLAAPARLLQARRLDQLELCCDKIEKRGDIFSEQAQRTSAGGAAFARVEHDPLARRRVANPRLAPPSWCRCRCDFARTRFRLRRRMGHGDRQFEIFKRELKLFDLALDLLGASSKLLLLQPCDADLQRLNERFQGFLGGGKPRDLLPLREDDRLQRQGIIGK